MRKDSIMTDIENINESIFESIKHVNEQGQEYWTARELQPVLEYKQWRQFSDVIDKAKAACDTSKIKVSDHFADVRKIVKAGASSRSSARKRSNLARNDVRQCL